MLGGPTPDAAPGPKPPEQPEAAPEPESAPAEEAAPEPGPAPVEEVPEEPQADAPEAPDEREKPAVPIEELTDEVLEAMPVVQLRGVARSLNVEGMTGREIRNARKEPLLAVIRATLKARQNQS